MTRNWQESVVRENRPLRLTRRGLETWNGRDTVALADERASNSEHKLRPTPGAPALDPTDKRDVETELWFVN